MPNQNTPDLSIRRFVVQDFDAVRTLYQAVWGDARDIRYDRMRLLETLSGPCPAVVAVAEDRCVGFYMVWPVPLSDGTTTVRGGQAIDTMTHPAFQGRGVLNRMGCACYRICAEEGIKVLFGAPNRAAYPGNIGRLNWSHTGSIALYARPLSLAGAVPGGRLVEIAAKLLPLKLPRGLEVRAAVPPEAELRAHLASIKTPQRRWHVARSPAWLAYRYQPTGRIDYTWLSLYRSGALQGFAVVGIPRGASRRYQYATLPEVVAPDPAMQRLTVGVAVQFAQTQAVHALITQFTAAVPSDALRANGFFRMRRTPLITRVTGPDCFEANPFVPAAWALFGGDFDIL